jgi:hypothetical protein
MGDAVLKEVSRRITNNIRLEDVFARLGGDEFTLIVEDFKNTQDVVYLAQKIIEVLEQPICIDEHMLYVSSSIGISFYPEDGDDAEQLLQNADAANNILGEDALLDGYPATQQGQLDYLIKLKNEIKNSGGHGLIYWEPAWVSTNCSTQWAQGSHWDNATLFDHNYKATLGINLYNQ